MKRLLIAAVAGALLGILPGCGPAAPKNYTHRWVDLVRDLAELDHLPDLTPRTITLMSSFDPTGGNNDFNQFAGAGSEPGWVTLLDRKGPGCVRRFWFTGNDPGHPVRIYIDGEKKPRIDTTLDALFGGEAPWLHPLARYANLCYASYVPIPYQESIRIETRGPNTHPLWGPRRLFYQFSVEDFPAGSVVESYPAAFTPDQLAAADEVRNVWEEAINGRDIPMPADTPAITIPAGETAVCLDLEGPGLLPGFSLRIEPAEPGAWSTMEREHLLHDVVLRVTYGGAGSASIAVPVGDFFANPWRKRAIGSLWFTSGGDGFASRLPMPYRVDLRIEIENGADRPVVVRLHAEPAPLPEGPLGYLHAESRRSDAGPHVVADWTGAGKYLGCILGVTGLDESWWILEGDETMWVDNPTRPAWQGTGLEDYFNGGWYYRGVFLDALSASFDRAPFRVGQYRFHQPDPVFFENTFRMQFERMPDERTRQPVRGVFQSVAFAYRPAPAPVLDVPASREARREPENPFHRKTFMLQLVELERMNDFEGALRAVEAYLETYPDGEEAPVYRLRVLEYRRHLGLPVPESEYDAFARGDHGEAVRQQAQLLQWFYAAPNRAMIGMNVNGDGRLFLNGRGVLQGDHPYNLFVAGVELAPGPQQLAAQVGFTRGDPWFQAGVRTHTGVAGTTYGTWSTLAPPQDWRTGAIQPEAWHPIGLRDIPRGVPDAPYIGGIPNAFILIQSKAYPVRALDWGYHRGIAYFRQDFTVPVEGSPAHTEILTGLRD